MAEPPITIAGTAGPRPLEVPATRSRPRRLLEMLLSAVLVVSTAGLAFAALGAATGHSLLIDRSDSMRPAIAAGDLLVVERVRPAEVRSGDIVTFVDPDDATRTITHRVVTHGRQGARHTFATRGDANGAGEEWSVARDGTVGLTRAVLPNLGHVAARLAQPWVRFALITVAGGLLMLALLRRIWSS